MEFAPLGRGGALDSLYDVQEADILGPSAELIAAFGSAPGIYELISGERPKSLCEVSLRHAQSFGNFLDVEGRLIRGVRNVCEHMNGHG